MFRRFILFTLGAVVALYLFWTGALVALRTLDPPTTGVQIQRRIEAFAAHAAYKKRYTFVPLARISPELQHAVISAEDGTFYRHHGLDWAEMRKVAEESENRGEITRGASTLTQQLVKNLFFTTHRNPLRKMFEYTLAPMADAILGKRRVLELYLNVVEWGPAGVFGIEEGAKLHYKIPAWRLNREQAARMAAILPAPRRWRPARMEIGRAHV